MYSSQYSQEEFDRAFKLLKASMTKGFAPSEKKIAFLLGGQSGAGKTLLQEILMDKYMDSPIVINGDEYRKLHPHFSQLDKAYGPEAVSHTAAWAGAMVEALVDALSEDGYNLIIEGTLRTSQVPINTARLLRERGYDVSLAIMAVKPEISLVSCQIRYEQMRIMGTVPRATDPVYHNKIVSEIANNLKVLEESGLFSQVLLFDRAENCLYPGEHDEVSASQVLRGALFGEWSEIEKGHLRFLKKRLSELQEME